MHASRPRSSVLGACLLAAVMVSAACDVWALGFEPASSAVPLGRPLDFQTRLQLDPGETLAPSCLRAEVSIGQRRLDSAAVRVDLEPATGNGAWVRVRSAIIVDEPTVAVNLYAGCPARVSRLYMLLADPAAAPAAPAGSVAPGAARLLAPPPPPARATLPPALGSPQASLRRVQATAQEPSAAARVVQARPAASGPRLRMEAADLPPAAGMLVADEVLDEALQAVALAASATRAAQAQARVQAERISELEQTVAEMRVQSRTAAARDAELQARVDRAERNSRWFTPLLVGAGVLSLLAAWLAWQLSQLQRLRRSAWRQAQAAWAPEEVIPSRQPTMPVPLGGSAVTRSGGDSVAPRTASAWPRSVASDSVLPPTGSSTEPGALPITQPLSAAAASTATAAVAASRSSAAGAATSAAANPAFSAGSTAARGTAAELDTEAAGGVASATQRTTVLPYGQAGVPRDVSIEELIDLEQQAEFFIVLGQDESAIDLLVEHLRSTGGGSPLPYLKLLEIYRRRGDREAYERTRTRFNHRFNAYAPDWSADLQHGRALEDYPEVMPRLQQVWARPLDAMAELEALLFRKSRGELFELPAYREVLFLYALARDLLDREAADTGSVDLLLPLGTAGGTDAAEGCEPSTAPGAWSGGDSTYGEDEQRPTAPVDLDLTLPDTPRASIFDPLTPAGSPRR